MTELAYCRIGGLHLTLQISIAQDERLQQSQWNKDLWKCLYDVVPQNSWLCFFFCCMDANKSCPCSHYRIAGGLTVKFYEAEFIKFLIIMKIEIIRNEQCIKKENSKIS